MRDYGNKPYWEIASGEWGTGVIQLKGRHHYFVILPDRTQILVPVSEIQKIEIMARRKEAA